MRSERTIEFLTTNKLLTVSEWETAKRHAESAGTTPLNLLVRSKRLSAEHAHQAYAHSMGWTYVNGDTLPDIPDDVIDLFSASDARRLGVVPTELQGGRKIVVAVPNPSDMELSGQIRSMSGGDYSVRMVYVPKEQLRRLVERYYSTSAEAAKKGEAAARSIKDSTVTVEAEEVGGEIVEALNSIINGALHNGASDIHLEPGSTELMVRYEIDGKLRMEPAQPLTITPRLISLVKSRAKLDSADLVNQDGTISHRYNGRIYDLRVAVLPAQWGESVTLRIADDRVRDLTEIGFAEDSYQSWLRGLSQPNGIVLATGPMGSGKTQLHMASLKQIMGPRDRKIVSLEAPVEVKLPSGITQVSINMKQGLTWEGAMETVLRSAAKVLFLGEINKEPIAHAAISAALTGHLVLSTLHTNDAPGAVVRLREMGVRPSVLADALRVVCAQRLPRTLCECKIPLDRIPDNLQRDFRLDREQIEATEWFTARPFGCPECGNTGYKGRAPIHEVMAFDAEVRELITEDAPNRKVAEAARANGMRTLQEDGLRLAATGRTSLEEVRHHILID